MWQNAIQYEEKYLEFLQTVLLSLWYISSISSIFMNNAAFGLNFNYYLVIKDLQDALDTHTQTQFRLFFFDKPLQLKNRR
jgi:hypothetical protein